MALRKFFISFFILGVTVSFFGCGFSLVPQSVDTAPDLTSSPTTELDGTVPEETSLTETTEEQARPSDDGSISIGVSYSTLKIENNILCQEGMRSRADELGVSLIERDSGFDPERQLRNVEELISIGVDVIVIQPTDPYSLSPCLTLARNSEIPVLVLGDVKTSGAFVNILINYEEAGRIQGEYIDTIFKKNARVALIKGPEEEKETIEMRRGLLGALMESEDIELVFEADGNWERSEAAALTESVVRQFGDVRIIICQSDAMAMGSYEAIKNMGKLDKFTIVGFGANLETLKAIKAGEVEATVDHEYFETGELAIDTAYEVVMTGLKDSNNLIHDYEVINTPLKLITIGNVDTTKSWGTIQLDEKN